MEEEYDGSLSFSEQGLEELKNIIIDFKTNGDYFVGRKYDDKDSFSNPGDCELIHVTYDMSYDTKENPVLLPEIYPAASVYIDLDDDETIYLDFCGLWKMKRVSWERTASPGKNVSGLG